jgi:hypothetical protein
VLLLTVIVRPRSFAATATLVVACVVLAVQVGVVRPRLTRRSDQVMAGLDAPRSRGHLVYVGLEVIKSLALVAGGGLLLWPLK